MLKGPLFGGWEEKDSCDSMQQLANRYRMIINGTINILDMMRMDLVGCLVRTCIHTGHSNMKVISYMTRNVYSFNWMLVKHCKSELGSNIILWLFKEHNGWNIGFIL